MINSILCPNSRNPVMAVDLVNSLDFRRGTGPLTHTRASTTLTVDSSGYYQQIAEHLPAFDSAGLRVTHQLKNKCECYSLFPAGYAFGTTATPAAPNGISSALTVGGDAAFVASVFDDSANIDGGTRKLSAIQSNGKILKLDNSGGATAGTVTISGATGNTNAHSYEFTYRGGTGSLVLGASSQALAGAANYSRVTKNNVTPGATDKLVISVAAGQTIYCLLPGLYESTLAPKYPIVAVGTVGGTTRAQTTASLPLAPNFRQDSFMVTCEWTPDFSVDDLTLNSNMGVLTLNAAGALNLLHYFKTGAGAGVIRSADGSSGPSVSLAVVSGTTYKIGVRGSVSLNQLQVSVNGVNGTATAYDGDFPTDGQNKFYVAAVKDSTNPATGASIKNLRITTDRGAAALAAATT